MQSNCKLLRDALKGEKGNVLLTGLVKGSGIPFRRVMIDFIVISGLILRLGY